MNLSIVTTTINNPTVAINRFASLGVRMVIAGDLKTNHKLYRDLMSQFKNVTYLSPEEQQSLYPELSTAIGWNCIQRRNIAMLYAYQEGATHIALVDDDNVPDDFWLEKMFLQSVNALKFVTKSIVANPLDVVRSNQTLRLWARGFPLDALLQGQIDYKIESVEVCEQPFILAGLWDGVPDFDVFGHLLFNDVFFLNNFYYFFSSSYELSAPPFVPFNSQNTVIPVEFLPNYFLFPFVGRMDDILASYYLQAVRPDIKVIFAPSSVIQARNEHDPVKDFSNELLGFTKINTVFLKHLAKDSNHIFSVLPHESVKAFEIWQKHF